jgi:hypothetical protein
MTSGSIQIFITVEQDDLIKKFNVNVKSNIHNYSKSYKEYKRAYDYELQQIGLFCLRGYRSIKIEGVL